MANDYNDIAKSILAEKSLGDFESLEDIINGRYFFVHSEQATNRNEEKGYGTPSRSSKNNPQYLTNIKLSNTRVPRGKPGSDKDVYGNEPGEVLDPDEDIESAGLAEMPDVESLSFAKILAQREEAPEEDEDEAPSKARSGSSQDDLNEYHAGDRTVDLENEAGSPTGVLRKANAALAKIYALMDEGYDEEDPEVQEAMQNAQKLVMLAATGTGSAVRDDVKFEKLAKEQLAP